MARILYLILSIVQFANCFPSTVSLSPPVTGSTGISGISSSSLPVSSTTVSPPLETTTTAFVTDELATLPSSVAPATPLSKPLLTLNDIEYKYKQEIELGYEIFIQGRKGKKGEDCVMYRYHIKIDLNNTALHDDYNFPACFSYACNEQETLIDEEERNKIFPPDNELFP